MPMIRNPSEKVASVKQWAGATIPAKWLDCDGAAVSRATYAALFAEVGTAYGVGDGATTFNLPDWRGRTPVGVGTGSGLTARARGASGGAETHPLTSAENGLHDHAQATTTILNNAGGLVGASGGSFGVGGTTGNNGSGTAHNNMQPYGCGYWIIKALP